MTFTTKPKIIATVCDIDEQQLNSICDWLHSKGLEFKSHYDRVVDNHLMYELEADITNHSGEFYLLLDGMMK